MESLLEDIDLGIKKIPGREVLEKLKIPKSIKTNYRFGKPYHNNRKNFC